MFSDSCNISQWILNSALVIMGWLCGKKGLTSWECLSGVEVMKYGNEISQSGENAGMLADDVSFHSNNK